MVINVMIGYLKKFKFRYNYSVRKIECFAVSRCFVKICNCAQNSEDSRTLAVNATFLNLYVTKALRLYCKPGGIVLNNFNDIYLQLLKSGKIDNNFSLRKYTYSEAFLYFLQVCRLSWINRYLTISDPACRRSTCSSCKWSCNMLCGYRLLATHARKKIYAYSGKANLAWWNYIRNHKIVLTLICVKRFGILETSSAIISAVHAIEYPEFQ